MNRSDSRNGFAPAPNASGATPSRWTPLRIVAVILAFAHLAWVAAGAAHRTPAPDNWLGAPLAIHSALSGTGTGFGYFSPEITSELRGRFELQYPDGQHEDDYLEANYSREALLRARIITSSISEHIDEKATRQKLAARWAEKVLARHPRANRIAVAMESYRLPSLVDYPKDPNVGWDPFYKVTFERPR